MKKPKRLNYSNGISGDANYSKNLRKYVCYLEKELKKFKPKKYITECDKCGDRGWIYSEDCSTRKICPCHY